jgi:hypothetical protein
MFIKNNDLVPFNPISKSAENIIGYNVSAVCSEPCLGVLLKGIGIVRNGKPSETALEKSVEKPFWLARLRPHFARMALPAGLRWKWFIAVR